MYWRLGDNAPAEDYEDPVKLEIYASYRPGDTTYSTYYWDDGVYARAFKESDQAEFMALDHTMLPSNDTAAKARDYL